MYCTLTELKARLGITSTADDTALTAVITAVSAGFDRYCNRKFTRSEEASLDWDATAREIPLDRYPVESVTSVLLRDHAKTAWIRQVVDYEIHGGCVLHLAAQLGDPGQIVRVLWIGGYVLPGSTATDGQTALPEDLHQAALDQAASWWQNRHNLRRETVSPAGSSTREPIHTAFLEQVTQVLDSYIRMVA